MLPTTVMLEVLADAHAQRKRPKGRAAVAIGNCSQRGDATDLCSALGLSGLFRADSLG